MSSTVWNYDWVEFIVVKATGYYNCEDFVRLKFMKPKLNIKSLWSLQILKISLHLEE